MLTQIKKLTTIIFIVFGLFTIGFQCKKETCNSDNIASLESLEYDYDFIVNMNVSPLQKVYNIGDTITLSFEISDNTLYDSKSQTDIELGHIKDNEIYFDMYIDVPYIDLSSLSFDQDPNFFITTNQPDIIYIHPYFNEVTASIPCELISDTFRFEIKLVPLKKGIYAAYRIFPPPSFLELLVQFNPAGSCGDNLNDFQIGDISYEFTDNNPELLEELVMPCDATPIIGLEQKTDEKEFFWIKVE